MTELEYESLISEMTDRWPTLDDNDTMLSDIKRIVKPYRIRDAKQVIENLVEEREKFSLPFIAKNLRDRFEPENMPTKNYRLSDEDQARESMREDREQWFGLFIRLNPRYSHLAAQEAYDVDNQWRIDSATTELAKNPLRYPFVWIRWTADAVYVPTGELVTVGEGNPFRRTPRYAELVEEWHKMREDGHEKPLHADLLDLEL